VTFKFQDAQFQKRFGEIIVQAEKPTAILNAAGRAVTRELKNHFQRKNQTQANKLSERRSGFWDQVARSVNQPKRESENSVSVTISDARFAQKLFGGTIHAKNAGALTIPVEERAYGRTAGTRVADGQPNFEQETGLKLFLVKSGKGSFENAVLAVKDSADSKAFTVEYVLTPAVDQKADPDALPPKATLEAAILVQGQITLNHQLDKK